MSSARAAFPILLLLLLTTGCNGSSSPDRGVAGPEGWETDLSLLEETLADTPGFPERAGPGFRDSVAALRERIPDIEAHRIVAGMARLAALGRDGHTEISLLQDATGFRRLPVYLKWFDDGPRVAWVRSGLEELLGGKPVAISGEGAEEALARVAPFVSADNRYEILYSGPLLLWIPEVLHAAGLVEDPESVEMVVERADGIVDTLRLAPIPADSARLHAWPDARRQEDDPPLYRRRPGDFHWFHHLETRNTLYLQIDRSRDQPDGETLAAFTRRFLDSADRIRPERLVVDLRGNVGGDFHLTEELAEGIGDRPRLSEKGRLFVITSHRTFSAGLMVAVQLMRTADPILVGEPSRGDPNGSYDVDVVRLPRSGLELEHTTRLHRPIPSLEPLDHVPVDIPVRFTFRDWSEGRDPALERILGTGP